MIQIAPGCIVCPTPIDPQKVCHAHTMPVVTESRRKHTAQTVYVHRENYVAHMFVRQAPAVLL